MIKQTIEQAVRGALEGLGAGDAVFVVERPRDMRHGDYATNAALVAKVDPNELARRLHIEGVEKVEVVGKFINFFLSSEALIQEVEAAAQEEGWGKNDLYKGKKVMVEYTDPNPFKEFHIGHLMSNAIGEAIARVLENASADVKRANYQGDVGLHVAKAIWGKMQKPELSWGEAYVYGNAEYENKKAEVDAINKKVYERSDEQINSLYDEGRKLSLEHFEELYKTLGTKFDEYFFESESTPLGTKLVNAHSDVFKESDGAKVFRGEEHGLHTRVFLTSQGLPTYEAKDLGLLELKSKEPLDTSITVTASEQNEYFKVVLAAAKQLSEVKDIAEKTKHVSHGMMRFAEGKMSSRKGNVITGESLLIDLKEAAKVKMQGRDVADSDKVAEQVAVGAIKYAVLKQGSGKDIIFDPVQSLSIEGDSGPYVQYAHTRALSLISEAQRQGIGAENSDAPAAANTLERLLVHYPDVIERAAKELEPHYITTYITELASAFNSWYASERVIGGTNPHYGILLASAVEKTLAKGLSALGIPAPEKM